MAVLQRFGRATTHYVDGWDPGIGREQHWGPSGDPPHHAPAGDPTPITPVKGRLYSGKIESLNRDTGTSTEFLHFRSIYLA